MAGCSCLLHAASCWVSTVVRLLFGDITQLQTSATRAGRARQGRNRICRHLQQARSQEQRRVHLQVVQQL